MAPTVISAEDAEHTNPHKRTHVHTQTHTHAETIASKMTDPVHMLNVGVEGQ